MATDERLSDAAPRAALVPEMELRQWRDELTHTIEALTDMLAEMDETLRGMPTEAGHCQLCGQAFGSLAEVAGTVATSRAERMPDDPRFCQRCASGAAYRELRERQAEAHTAERAKRGDR